MDEIIVFKPSKSKKKVTEEKEDWLEFEIKEAKKRYDAFPYWKKKHFESVRRSMDAKAKRDLEHDPYNNGGSW